MSRRFRVAALKFAVFWPLLSGFGEPFAVSAV